jgi:hypothetical protein
MLKEIAILVIFTPPLVDVQMEKSILFHGDYNLDDVITILMFMRVYTILVAMASLSR